MTKKTTKPEIRNVVLYARVSTSEQAEKDLSIPAQLDALRRYCSQHGYVVSNEYVEPGFSAHQDDDRRPAFRKMIADVMAPDSNVEAILVCYTSRFYRNRSNAGAMKVLLRKRGIRVLAIFQATTDDPMGQFVEGIFELVDQYESDVNGMRTSAAMHKNAELGFHNGSKAPYGFIAEPVEVRPGQIKRRLVPNPEEVPIHNEIVRQYVAKQGAKQAARDLNQRGYRYRGGKLWSKDLVLKVIEETAAIGSYVWAKETPEPVPQKVEPIIDKDLFDMAQRVRELRDPKKNPGRTRQARFYWRGWSLAARPAAEPAISSKRPERTRGPASTTTATTTAETTCASAKRSAAGFAFVPKFSRRRSWSISPTASSPPSAASRSCRTWSKRPGSSARRRRSTAVRSRKIWSTLRSASANGRTPSRRATGPPPSWDPIGSPSSRPSARNSRARFARSCFCDHRPRTCIPRRVLEDSRARSARSSSQGTMP
jgi:DNA invertase Pin-like site-specific DNA recombinase